MNSNDTQRPAGPDQAAGPATAAWLVRCRNAGWTPDQICVGLVEHGWDADAAAAMSLHSLRSSDRHQLLYNGLCWGAGLGVLGAGSAAHIALTAGRDPVELASAITLMLVATPLAIGCGIVARKVESNEAHSIWSPTRRVLFATLAACTAVVGLFRLLAYTFEAVAAAVGADGFDFTPASVVQVMVTICLAGPLFWWSLSEWKKSSVVHRSLTSVGRVERDTSAPQLAGTVGA